LPRVDPGWWLVEYASIEKEGLALEAAGWALSSRAYLVTSPSPVTVDLGVRKASIVAGIGSLVSPYKPPLGAYKVSAVEWVDACPVEGEPSHYLTINSGEHVIAEGVVRAYTMKNIISLFINGVKGRFKLYKYELRAGEYPLATVEGLPIVVGGLENVVLLTDSSEVKRKLDYIVPLAAACGLA